jgi:hypothetical protein
VNLPDVYYGRVLTERIMVLIHEMNLPPTVLDSAVAHACEVAAAAAFEAFKKELALPND